MPTAARVDVVLSAEPLGDDEARHAAIDIFNSVSTRSAWKQEVFVVFVVV